MYLRLRLFCAMLLLMFFGVKPLLAQWTPTGLMAGNINTVFNNNESILAGFNGGSSLIVSTDNGANWHEITSGLVQYSDVRAFAGNQTYVFAGTTNGVYRCLNDGNYNWTKVLNNVSCFALLINGNNLYAGALGAGINVSTDNGNTWNTINNGLTSTSVYALTAHGAVLFAGTTASGVFRSTDGGQSWSPANTGITNMYTMSLTVKDNYVYTGSNGGGIARSSDDGVTWQHVADGITHTLHVVCSNIYAGFLSGGGIAKTSDYGNSWVDFSTGLPNTGGYTVTSITHNSSFIFAGTLGGGIARAPYNCLASIGGYKFFDANGNGVKDSSESKLPGWIINLAEVDSLGSLSLHDTTDQNGAYFFDSLPAGRTYHISETPVGGWHQTHPASSNGYTIYLPSGQSIDTLNFGNKPDSAMSCVEPPAGMVAWYPLDEQVGATVINDIMGGHNGVPQPQAVTTMGGHGPIQSSTLQFLNPRYKVDGALYFTPNTTNNYIRVPDSPTLNFGTGDFSVDAWVFYPVIGPSYILPIVEKSQTYNANNCIGFRLFIKADTLNFILMDGTQMTVTKATVHSSVWQHIAVVRKGGSPNTVQIYINGMLKVSSNMQMGSISNTTDLLIAGIDGLTSPCGLPAVFNTGEIAIDEVEIFNRALLQNDVISVWNADSLGKCKTASICGTKFNDLNGNGIRDNSEPGLANWKISLNMVGIPAATTDSLGNFCFFNLPVGTYTISEIQQSGWVQTAPSVPGTYTVMLHPGENISNIVFGNKADSSEACVSWSLTDTTLVTSVLGNIHGTPEVMSAGSSSPYMQVFYPYNGGQRLWVGNTGWVAGPLDVQRYIEFNAAANSGYNFTATNVSFNYNDNPLGVNFNIVQFQAFYSTDGWQTSIALNNSPLIYLNTAVQLFNQAVNAAVQAGGTFSLRIYPYALNNGIAMTPTFATHSNVRICGTTEQVTDVKSDKPLPKQYKLMQNYPNPFNPSTVIGYAIPNAGYVKIAVYNILGQEVKVLVSSIQSAGEYSVQFDANDLSSGTYFYSIRAGNYYEIKKMILLR